VGSRKGKQAYNRHCRLQDPLMFGAIGLLAELRGFVQSHNILQELAATEREDHGLRKSVNDFDVLFMIGQAQSSDLCIIKACSVVVIDLNVS